MAQLSPRMLNIDMEDEQSISFSSATLSPISPGQSSLSPGRPPHYPSPSRLPPNPPEAPGSPVYVLSFLYESSINGLYLDRDITGQSWPAVPFASIKDNLNSFEGKVDRPPSLPSLAVNGVTTSAPRSYMPSTRPAIDAQSETKRRKKELEDEQALCPPISSPNQGISSPPPIPLSPDPFGRYSSMAESSTTVPVAAHGAANIAAHNAQSMRLEGVSEVSQAQRQGRPTTSRFSTDSVTGEDLASLAKASNRATLISVRSFAKLWRKSDNKKSISSISPVLPTTPATSSGRSSPMAPPPRPERPSEEQLDLPDVPDMPAPARLSPQPLSSQPSPREQMHPSRRPSQDQYIALPPSRPSLEQLSPPIQLVHSKQLSVPLHPGKNRNSPTARSTQPQDATMAANLDRRHFDQQSPYPVHRCPPVRQSPRPPSPPPMPPIPEQEKPTARKSILKWKSSTSHDTNASVSEEAQSRSSFERAAGAAVSSRGRPSVINFGSTRTSVTDPLPSHPPIPDYFINKNGPEYQQPPRSRFVVSPTESYSPPPRQSSVATLPPSPARSKASSRGSQETRPSLDDSQFEIVSPRLGGSLNYPYHALDQ